MAKRRHSNNSSRKRVRSRAATDSSDFEKGVYIAVISFAIALTALLAHGAAYSHSYRPWSPIVFEHQRKAEHSLSPIYGRAMLLNARYDSRPYWRGSKLMIGTATNRETADLAIEHLIPCESGGRIVDRLDTNGKMSYGILQFQDWPEWEHMSGISGDPDNPDDAIRMAEWGIEHGMIDHWACARILGEI
jgi:hypothetical protein